MTLLPSRTATLHSWLRTYGPCIVVALVLLVAPHFFYPLFLAKILCFALFACAFNLLLGSCGLLSFGQAAYYGTAAYVAAFAAKEWNLPFEISIVLGALAAAVLGTGFGYLAIRREGLQFAMITLALAQMIYFLALQLPFTHAEDGLTGVPRGKVLGLFSLDDSTTLYCTVAAIFIVGLFCVHRITHSTFGQVLRSIRDNEPRAISLGFDANRFKLLAFTLSATLAGVAGAAKAITFKLATLTDVHWSTSGSVILMTLLGGLGTFWGPVVGAIVVVTLEDYLADSGLPIEAVIGAIFILCILLFRRGVVGELQALLLHRSSHPKSRSSP
jgi:branched-chain amino acid transport system permease protein